jgi:hypothetical protein
MFSLNKIGKNPHLVSDRENLVSDCQTMNAIVNALSASRSPGGSSESLTHHPQQAGVIFCSVLGREDVFKCRL